jgi:hypothetical protein
MISECAVNIWHLTDRRRPDKPIESLIREVGNPDR